MTNEEVTRLMSQLGAGLREHVAPPDQWAMSTIPTDGSTPRYVYVRFTRLRENQPGLYWDQFVSVDMLAQSVLTPRNIGRELARCWEAGLHDAGH